MSVRQKNECYACHAESRAYRTDQQEFFAPDPIDDGHGQDSSRHIGSADRYGLKIARYFAEARTSKDIV